MTLLFFMMYSIFFLSIYQISFFNFQFYQPPNRKTQVEEIDDLLDEIANEVEIDSHRPDPATYVEDRLAHLREDNNG